MEHKALESKYHKNCISRKKYNIEHLSLVTFKALYSQETDSLRLILQTKLISAK